MKKIILATLTAGAITAVGGIAVATINQNQIGAPMSQEPQTIIEEPEVEEIEIEYVKTPEEADIVVEKIIDEPVEAKDEVVETKEEPETEPEPEPEPKVQNEDVDPKYQAVKDYVMNTAEPNSLEGLKFYQEVAYNQLVKAKYTSVEEYLADSRYLEKGVHYPRSIILQYFGIYNAILSQK